MSNVQCPTSRLVIGHSTLDICLSHGEGGIRTPDRSVSPYNGLANRRLQPLGHLSDKRNSQSNPFCWLRSKGARQTSWRLDVQTPASAPCCLSGKAVQVCLHYIGRIRKLD